MFSYLKYMLKNEDHLYLKINATIKTYEEAFIFSDMERSHTGKYKIHTVCLKC